MFKMTANILKNAIARPATRRYPAVSRPIYADVRGELVNAIEQCTFCGVCAAKCPSLCIMVDKKTALWEYDPFCCVYCGVCVDNCRPKALHQRLAYRPPTLVRQFIRLQGKIPESKNKESTIDAAG